MVSKRMDTVDPPKPAKINILILGGGGREHALAKQIQASPVCDRLFITPGNAGTALCGRNVPLDISDFDALTAWVSENDIHLVVAGPEEPLVLGLADRFAAHPGLGEVAFLGPGADGARLEGSKAFAKDFMMRHGIPTAPYRSFSRAELPAAQGYLKHLDPPYVLKADGLAAGKGVLICPDHQTAARSLDEMLGQQLFGKASSTVVIEAFLRGREVSVFVLTDGTHYKILPSAKDYKRVGEQDRGPNTGGMGTVSPVPFAHAEFMSKVEERIIKPTIAGLTADGVAYKGFLFFGLMEVKGDPYVIEYNIRMGDPEAQVVLPRLRSDLAKLLWATATGRLQEEQIEILPDAAVSVVLASGGYPGPYQTGFPIGLPQEDSEVQVFFAGVKEADGKLLTSGGRVMAVTGMGDSIKAARERAYRHADTVQYQEKYCRRDIGLDLID